MNSAPKGSAATEKKLVKTATTPSVKTPVKAVTAPAKSSPKPVKSVQVSTSNKKTNDQIMSIDILPYQESKDGEYMNTEQQEHFRKLLLQWKQQLLHEMNRTVHHLQDEAANFPDPNDRATQEEEFSLELRARDRERKLIAKIEEALRKIEEGEYGYCDACGIEIGVHRLEARPTANLCIDCKTLDEIREKQMGG